MPGGTDLALVADAGRARVLMRRAPAGAWRELADQALENPTPPSRDLGSERPGRVHESASPTRHAIEPRSDPHRAARQAFARLLADRLDAQSDRFGRLLLVAPPAFLGELRAALGDAARARLAGSLDRDLTRLPEAELARQLDEVETG
jgi:protein required for attachment to host cells